MTLRRRANARNVSFRISLRWLIHSVNPVWNIAKEAILARVIDVKFTWVSN